MIFRKHTSTVVSLVLSAAVAYAQADKTHDFIRAEMQRQNIPGLSEVNIVYGLAALYLPAQKQKASGTASSSKLMADGKWWTTSNLYVNTIPSYCYQDEQLNCRRYGRLYTWDSAKQGCQSLGDGWRLPTDDEWRQMAKHYGGVHGDSNDGGKAAYKALLSGGNSGFNAVLGGGRSVDGQYARLDAHGFYWTASENDSVSALFYNFGKGGLALYRQTSGEKQRAFSVRCIKDDD